MKSMSSPTSQSVHSLASVSEKLAEWEEQRSLRSAPRTAVYVSAPITTGPT